MYNGQLGIKRVFPKIWESFKDDVKIIHYTGLKPWQWYEAPDMPVEREIWWRWALFLVRGYTTAYDPNVECGMKWKKRDVQKDYLAWCTSLNHPLSFIVIVILLWVGLWIISRKLVIIDFLTQLYISVSHQLRLPSLCVMISNANRKRGSIFATPTPERRLNPCLALDHVAHWR